MNLNFNFELYFYLDTVNLSDKIIILLQSIITVTIYFNLYKHDLKFKSKIEKNKEIQQLSNSKVDPFDMSLVKHKEKGTRQYWLGLLIIKFEKIWQSLQHFLAKVQNGKMLNKNTITILLTDVHQ